MSERRTAVITGGSLGIGLETAKALAREDYHVVISGRRQDVLDQAVAEIKEAVPDTGNVVAVASDIADEAQSTALVEDVISEFGRLDALVNNAAYVRAKNVSELTMPEWDEIINVTLRGSAVVSLIAARQMREQGSGRVVMVGSQSGVFSDPNLAAYNAGKAGLHSLGRSMAVDLAPYGVAVNTVAPGWVRTPMVEKFMTDTSFLASINPMARAGEADECAEVIRWLVVDAPVFLTGTTIFFDGGETAMAKVHRD
jgi:NAD(P)-dependent dehydrogenase (short-subunit alcohol dehydrogenase family)